MPVLSKSKLIAYRQCPKRLWLEVHHPELREDTSGTTASFVSGNEVGDIARAIYDPLATGTMLDLRELGMAGLLARTQELIDRRKPIFEAGFSIGSRSDGALSLADVLLPDPDDGSWRMVEVKSSTKVHPYHLEDSAIQLHIATHSGLRVSKVAVAHIDSKWTYPGDNDRAGLLREVDVSELVLSMQPDVAGWIAAAHKVVADKSEPDIEMGTQCSEPFDCGFRGHCDSQVVQAKGSVQFPVHWLPDIKARALKEHIAQNDVRDMADVPDQLLTRRQLRVKQQTLAGEVFFDRAGAAQALAPHGLPAMFLDFETISFAVPRWPGTRPYQQIAFQYSLHSLDAAGELTHTGFLDLSGEDPGYALAKSLVEGCEGDGPIFVYNKGFEGARIGEMAERFANLRAPLQRISTRLVDLLPVAKEHYYHPDQQGSWSIKKVLPAVAPELRYQELEGVQDGGQAQSAYCEAIVSNTNVERRQQLHEQLWAYCALDTFAMVRLWAAFSGKTGVSIADKCS